MSPDAKVAIKQIRTHLAPLRTDLESIRLMIDPAKCAGVGHWKGMLNEIEHDVILAIERGKPSNGNRHG